MKIYFVRHGQTDWNAEHRIMGKSDIELNETGKRQAQELRDAIANHHFDVILSSPLLRAKQTADIVAELHPNTPVIVASELSERSFGDFEGKDNNGDYYGLWQHDNAHTPNGETPHDLEKRIFPFLEQLGKKYKNKNVLLVAHGGVGLTIESYYRGIPASKNLLEYVAGNGELKIYESSGDNTP